MTTQKTGAKVFDFLNDDIRAGAGDIVLPGSDALSGVIKRYESGGENRMHSHPSEDHTFYILDGEATFHLESDENEVVASKFQAVFIPKGTPYWFQSSSPAKLIILRAGTETGSDRIIEGRIVPSQRTRDDASHVTPRALPF
jgi:quercetin dioxygenase-like cupin family protein